MTRAEAIVASKFNAICKYAGIEYYACGIQYFNKIDRESKESIILHDRNVNSITYAPFSLTQIIDWNAPEWLIKSEINRIKALYGD